MKSAVEELVLHQLFTQGNALTLLGATLNILPTMTQLILPQQSPLEEHLAEKFITPCVQETLSPAESSPQSL